MQNPARESAIRSNIFSSYSFQADFGFASVMVLGKPVENNSGVIAYHSKKTSYNFFTTSYSSASASILTIWSSIFVVKSTNSEYKISGR
jgi:hypothetical protein